MQLKDKQIPQNLPGKPWESVGTDIFTYLCIIDYHKEFPLINLTNGLIADILIITCKIIFAEQGLPRNIMSDAGTNIVSEEVLGFCKHLNIHQAMSLSYNHQSNGEA